MRGFLTALWLVGFFLLRNGWFTLFEMGSRGATPGKRVMGLRVVARDGARLTGAAVIARNAMREIEVFLPLSFFAQQSAQGTADTFLTLFSLLWSGIFLFFPLFNRDRLRVGDLVAGTWVIQVSKATLNDDLAFATQAPGAHSPDPPCAITASSSCRHWSACCARKSRPQLPPSANHPQQFSLPDDRRLRLPG